MRSAARQADIEGLERALADLQSWQDHRRSSLRSNQDAVPVCTYFLLPIADSQQPEMLVCLTLSCSGLFCSHLFCLMTTQCLEGLASSIAQAADSFVTDTPESPTLRVHTSVASHVPEQPQPMPMPLSRKNHRDAPGWSSPFSLDSHNTNSSAGDSIEALQLEITARRLAAEQEETMLKTKLEVLMQAATIKKATAVETVNGTRRQQESAWLGDSSEDDKSTDQSKFVRSTGDVLANAAAVAAIPPSDAPVAEQLVVRSHAHELG